MKATPYISFNGNCEEAVKYYQSILGGDINLMRFSDLPENEGVVSENWASKIMHGSLTLPGGQQLYFGDSWEGQTLSAGTNVTIHLNTDSAEEVYSLVEKLSQGGKLDMNAGEMFWGSVYGSCSDKFSIHWGVEYELPGEQT